MQITAHSKQTGMHRKSEKGDTFVEFAGTLPFMMILFASVGFAAWLFWAQAAADAAAVSGIRASSMYRGNGRVYPGMGYEEFEEALEVLAGRSTSGVIGTPSIETNRAFRYVRLFVTGGTEWDFGPLSGEFSFGGGGATRLHNFYPGPPDPWE